MKKLTAIIVVAVAVFAGCGGEDYQGADGQRRYCDDIGTDYDANTNTCKVRAK